MASVQTGIAVVYGCPGTISGIASVVGYNDGADFGAEHVLDEVRDEDNDVRTMIHSGETLECSITFTPRAPATAANDATNNTKTKALLSLAKPVKGIVVTLAGFNESVAGDKDGSSKLINGTWSYVGGWRIVQSKAGVTQYSMRLRRSLAYDIVTAAGA